jgi:hypothetical protein
MRLTRARDGWAGPPGVWSELMAVGSTRFIIRSITLLSWAWQVGEKRFFEPGEQTAARKDEITCHPLFEPPSQNQYNHRRPELKRGAVT